MQDLKNIIESLLFVAEEPLTVEKLRSILETVDSKEIRSVLQLLTDDYEQRGGGFWLREIAGGWQIRSRPEYHEWIKRMLQPSPQKLSRAALETLAVVAYKQPIIRADIEHIRGVDCGGVLRQLMERKLIRVLGRKEIAGRPLIYATTKLFLEMFDLKDLNDLPTPKEIATFGNMPINEEQKDSQDLPSETTEAIVDENELPASAADPEPPLSDDGDITQENLSSQHSDAGQDEISSQEIASGADQPTDAETKSQTMASNHVSPITDGGDETQEERSTQSNDVQQAQMDVSPQTSPSHPPTEHSAASGTTEHKAAQNEILTTSEKPLDGDTEISEADEDDNTLKNT